MSILYTCPFFLFFVLHFHDFCRILMERQTFLSFDNTKDSKEIHYAGNGKKTSQEPIP